MDVTGAGASNYRGMDIVRTQQTAAGAIANAHQRTAEMQSDGFLGMKALKRGVWHAVNPKAKMRYESELNALKSLPETIQQIMKMIQEKYAALGKV